LFMAMSKDLRVILVKLADRLHNMRTIKAMRPEKQAQKARETMDIYAPLAGRMGMQWMRDELEDLAFRVLNPEGRASIIRRFIRLQKESGDVIERITTDMRHELSQNAITADVFGRAKKPYSIWRKMEEKEQGFSRLSDIYGFRIITASEEDCYRILGVIHQRCGQARDVFRSGLLLHAQGRSGQTAARSNTAGFRLRDPYAHRIGLCRGESGRAAGAALDAAQERAIGRDRDRAGSGATGHVA